MSTYRAKQEENERRKSEEKARREAIFKQYMEKKEEEEEGPKREKPKQKPRPKSMFVKAAPGIDGDEACSSNEDLSAARAFTIPADNGNSSTACELPAPYCCSLCSIVYCNLKTVMEFIRSTITLRIVMESSTQNMKKPEK